MAARVRSIPRSRRFPQEGAHDILHPPITHARPPGYHFEAVPEVSFGGEEAPAFVERDFAPGFQVSRGPEGVKAATDQIGREDVGHLKRSVLLEFEGGIQISASLGNRNAGGMTPTTVNA